MPAELWAYSYLEATKNRLELDLSRFWPTDLAYLFTHCREGWWPIQPRQIFMQEVGIIFFTLFWSASKMLRRCKRHNRAKIYLFKVKDWNIRKSCEIYSNLTTKTSERLHWSRSDTLIINFEHISYLFLVFLLLALSTMDWFLFDVDLSHGS